MKYFLIDDSGIVKQVQPYFEEGFMETDRDDVVCGMVMNKDGSFSLPPKTPEQIKSEEEYQASQARDEAMLKGFDYNGYQCSVTKDDGDGMMQVEAAFIKIKRGIELGLIPPNTPISTVIHFKNGTKLPIAENEFEAFSILFSIERGKFFQ